MKFSSKIEKCELSPIRKFHSFAMAAEAKGRTIYHLNIGQPDVETPRQFFDAARDFGDKVLEYAPSQGVPEYIEAVKQYYARIGVPLASEDILATTGGSEALQIIMHCLLDDGDELLTPEPFYPNYSTFVTVTGAVIKPIPTTAEDGYRYADRALIESCITERTRAILLTNPGNPTGTVLTKDELHMLCEIAVAHNIFLVADEVYREFVYSGGPLSSVTQLEEFAQNVIVVDSVSKRFSACGARVGAIISRNREFMSQAMKLCQGRLCVATLDQVAAAALYSVEPAYFAAVREEYKRRRDAAMAKLLAIPGVVCRCPEGAFYIMAKLPVDNADSFQQWLLEEFADRDETVMFSPGEGFYATPGKGVDEIRIAYVIKQEHLERAVELLGLGIAAYNNR
ncbi:MAG: pyridoxal phosphate-dependent aminotransferase [Oscillospiraceae bacterium]